MSLTGPQGTPSGERIANQADAGRAAIWPAIASARATRWATRSGLCANRGSAARWGTPRPWQSAANCRSFPTATTIGRSAVGKTSYGAIDGCRLPMIPGTTPAAV
jgi:hypothetical protein